MANPQGFTAEVSPAVKANKKEAPTNPPRKELELPDKNSTKPFTPSMSFSWPINIAPRKAIMTAVPATKAGTSVLRSKLVSFDRVRIVSSYGHPHSLPLHQADLLLITPIPGLWFTIGYIVYLY